MVDPSGPRESWFAQTWRRITTLWLASQVELRGQYSVQRMLAFDAYRRVVYLKRVVQLLFLTFVPGLVMEMVLEAIPLGPYTPGRDTTGPRNFWIRTTLGTYIVTHSLVGQYRQNIPRLQLSTRQLVGLSIATTTIVLPIFFGVSTLVGFPVPFFVVLAMIPWTPIVVSICAFLLRHQIRREPDIVPLIVKYTYVFMAQTCLIVVYPAFSHVFNTYPQYQTTLALLLPIMKLFFKNWFGFASRHIEDLKPELVVFNVEIFSALYVSTCMQNSTSVYATAIIMGVDFTQAWLSIKDLNDVLNDRDLQQALTRAYRSAHGSSANTHDLIPLTMFIFQSNPFVRNHASIQLRSCAPRAEAAVVHANTRILPQDTRPPLEKRDDTSTTERPPTRSINTSVEKAETPRLASATTRLQSAGRSRLGSLFLQFAQQSVQHNLEHLAAVANQLSDDEQLLVARKTLQILHICEFIALIEYSEVFVPIVYSIFSTVAYTFPNRQAFVTLRAVTPAQFVLSLQNVVLYGSLELVSYLALHHIVKRKFGVSAFAQTAFVLETQWPMVQSKLTLWMIIALQFAHSFYGNDFTFQFKWLRQPATA